MKRKFIRDVSVNTLQVIIVQCCGLLIFYLLSTRLEKNEFGELNWALAVLLTAFGILAFGIDQIAVRRIASGADANRLLSTYMIHVLLAGGIFYGFLWIGFLIFPVFFQQHNFLLLLGFAKLMIYFSTPFKQLATGLEKFRPLLLMSVTSNVLRCLALLLCAAVNKLDVQVIIIIFMAGDLAEFLVSLFIMQRILKAPLRLHWNIKEYKGLIKESLPQFGVAIFSSALSRLDWIFLGLLASNVILANYSFAYKVFEVATLPMLVIAPVLIPRFTKLFHPQADELTAGKAADLFVLLRVEMIIASLVALLMNICWVPVIDLLTHNKYGAVNRQTILLLSASMPFLYFNNFLWTVNFAKGRLKMIFYIFLTSFVINLAADIILIPFFNAEGAAVAYLIAIMLQSVMYLKQSNLGGLKKNSYTLLLYPLLAIAAGILSTTLFGIGWLSFFAAPFFYLLFLLLTGQLRYHDWLAIKRVTGF